jgi:ankyrin repeat protein
MTNEAGFTALHRAFIYSSATLEDIRRLIDDDPQALAKLDRSGQTPLHLACFFPYDSDEIIQLLLDRSPQSVLGVADIFGRTPLHNACLEELQLISFDR